MKSSLPEDFGKRHCYQWGHHIKGPDLSWNGEKFTVTECRWVGKGAGWGRRTVLGLFSLPAMEFGLKI